MKQQLDKNRNQKMFSANWAKRHAAIQVFADVETFQEAKGKDASRLLNVPVIIKDAFKTESTTEVLTVMNRWKDALKSRRDPAKPRFVTAASGKVMDRNGVEGAEERRREDGARGIGGAWR